MERIEAAVHSIDPVFLNTPQFESEPLSDELGMRLVLKVETVNPIRCFKGRGTDLFVSRLGADSSKLVCASAGNFGQGLAYAARKRGFQPIVFAAETASPVKIERMRRLGAEVRLFGSDFDEAKQEARRFAEGEGHKLSSFIVKSPPGGAATSGAGANGKKGGKKSRKGKHNNTSANDDEQAQPSPGGAHQNGNDGGDSPVGSDQGDDEETIAKINAEAAELVEPETNKLGEDDEWGVDTSAAAVQARQKALEETMAKVALAGPAGDDDEEEEDTFANGSDNPYDQLGTWIQNEQKENNKTPGDVEIYKKAKELGIEAKSKTLTVLVQCVFTENICKEISQRAALFRKACTLLETLLTIVD